MTAILCCGPGAVMDEWDQLRLIITPVAFGEGTRLLHFLAFCIFSDSLWHRLAATSHDELSPNSPKTSQPPVLEDRVHLKVIATGVSNLKEWDEVRKASY